MTMGHEAASNYKDGTHVVLIASPPAGHTVPLLQLARALASCGVVVSIVCTDLHLEELKAAKSVSPTHALNIRFVALQDGTAISSTTFIDMMRDQPSLEARLAECLDLLLGKMLMSGEHNHHQLGDNANFGAPPPCCVISSIFVIGWAHDIVTKHHLESHLLCTSPASWLCFLLKLDRLMTEGRVPVTPENESQIITSIPGLPSLHPLDLPRPFLNPTSTRSDFPYRHFIGCGSPSVILLNTCEELEGEALDGLRSQVLGGSDPLVKTRSIIPIGPMCSLQEADGHETMEVASDENPCLQWLKTQPPGSVLYVAFGSARTGPLATAQLQDLAEGLEASGQPFLWVLKIPGVCPTATMESTLPAMSDLLPPGFLGRVEGRAFIYSGWAPQQEILKHPATAGFLTHCGWNSTLESISAGVPMLTWPLTADQPLIARFLVDTSKLAIQIEKADKDFYKKEAIKTAVRSLFSEEEGGPVRKRVKDMCYSATHSASKQNIVKYVNDLQTCRH